MMRDPPPDIIEAARRLLRWAESHHLQSWSVMGIGVSDNGEVQQHLSEQLATNVNLRVDLEIARRDMERLNALESEPGIAVINDDNGHWAVSSNGYQNVPVADEPIDIETAFFVPKDQWKPTIRDAIDAYIDEMQPDRREGGE